MTIPCATGIDVLIHFSAIDPVTRGLSITVNWLGIQVDVRGYHAIIRERGSVLYLGMAKEISKYHTDAPAGKRPKKLLPPKPSMQTE